MKDTISTIAALIKKSSKITVFTGAGISTNCGIPDFRGPNGLYNSVSSKYNLPFPEAIFEINYFYTNPYPFFDLTREILSQNITPAYAHRFIARLEEEGRIALVMTQNIDMLHQKAGSKRVVECHGTYETAHCIRCEKKYQLEEIADVLKQGMPPLCECKGVIKPDIVFFGEQLPELFYGYYERPPETDLLLVMGSSLSVMPAANFALKLTYSVPSVLINFDETHYDHLFTHIYRGDTDEFCKKVDDWLKQN